MTRTQKYRNTKKGMLANNYSKMMGRNIDRGHGDLPFSLDDFRDWAMSQPKYDKLFNAYISSDRNRWLAPSFDRDDITKGYSFDNMKLMTWEENDDKDRNTHRSIPVEQWNKERTILINSFSSARDAEEETGAPHSKISLVCNGHRKSSGGYWWKFPDSYKPEKSQRSKIRSKYNLSKYLEK